MAKKKASPTPDPDDRVSVINLKGSRRYRDWLNGITEKTHIPAAAIVRLALKAWSKANKHHEPPEI